MCDIIENAISASNPDLARGSEWVMLNNCVGTRQQNTGAPPHAPLKMNSGQQWKTLDLQGSAKSCVRK